MESSGRSELRTARCLLRPWTMEDVHVEAVLAAARDPEIAYYSSVGVARTPALAHVWIRGRDDVDRLDFAVSVDESTVGRASLAHIDPVEGVAEIGYWLLPQSRGRGIASEAVGALEDLAFGRLALGRLVIRHEPSNDRSCLLARRRGYLDEGTARGAFERHGGRVDLHLHARLVTDPPVQ